MNILLVEDDRAVAESISLLLRLENMSAEIAALGQEGIDLARRGAFDLIILDLGLADMSGFDVLDALRCTAVHTPVLIVSGDSVVDSRTRALRIGADDFVVKPFHKDELMARIHAILRRSQVQTERLVSVGDLLVNLDNHTVDVAGVPVRLTVKEYMVLEAMALRKGATLSKDVFLHHLYDGRDEPSQKIIDVFICKLRRKIADAANGANYIRTVWGQGYALADPEAPGAVAA